MTGAMRIGFALALLAALGAWLCGRVAFGHHDAHPVAIEPDRAGGEPENRWASIRGHVDEETLRRYDRTSGGHLVVFMLRESDGDLVVAATTKQLPFFAENAPWEGTTQVARLDRARREKPDAEALVDAYLFLTVEQTLVGTLEIPGRGFRHAGEVKIDGDAFDVASYCEEVGRRCPREARVLMLGVDPWGRALPLLGTFGCVLVGLFALGFTIRRGIG